MTMMSSAHPDPERLAALAGADPEALADSVLTGHVAGCVTCGQQVRELSSLRATLAELPDLAPSRPLQLVPPVSAPAAPTGWRMALRRAFAPVAVAGMVLLLVGGIGATGSLGPADAQRLISLPFQSAERQAVEEAPPQVTSTDEVAAPAATVPADTDVGALAPTPGAEGAAAGGAEDDSDTPRGEETPAPAPGNDLLAETTVTSGWILLALLGLGLLVVALVLRLVVARPAVPDR